MSRNNPTPSEAQERRYTHEIEYKKAIESYNHYKSEYSKAQTKLNNLNSKISDAEYQKSNFQKRLKGIKHIIAMLEGTADWFSVNVPSSIESANKDVNISDINFKECFKSSEAQLICTIKEAFNISDVSDNTHSSFALERYKAERDILEEKICKLDSSIDRFNGDISIQKSKIKNINIDMKNQKKIINYNYNEMKHYQKFM